MRRFATTLALLALAALAIAVLVIATGGFTLHVGPIALRLHNPVRIEWLAALCGVGYVILARERLADDLDRAHRAIDRSAAAIALALSLGAVVTGIVLGAFVAAGSDSYGYVSQADLWLSGTLQTPEPAAARVPISDADWVFSPLGYRPAPTAHHLVPTYPPGLPWMMALAKALAGAGAVYYVVPLFGGLLIWQTWRLGSVLDSRLVGLAAAAMLLANATFLYQVVLPMSDVPAAALWCAAAVAVLRGTDSAMLLAGFASGLALAVRPNLFPLALVFAAWIPALAGDWRRGLRRTCAYGLGAAPIVGALAALNWRLYGHPFSSGYGSLSALYSWTHVIPNLRRFAAWLIETQGVPALAWIAMGLPLGFSMTRTRRGFAISIVLALWIAYLPYLVFDDRSFLRFLLPGMPMMMTLAVMVWRDVFARVLPAALASAAVIACTVATICYELEIARVTPIATMRIHEQRYVQAAAAIHQSTPNGAVCVALQHTGSLRYYGGCVTARYDWLRPRQLCQALETFRASGLQPYIVLDEWEREPFRQRFDLAPAIDAWPWPRIAGPPTVTIFDARQAGEACR